VGAYQWIAIVGVTRLIVGRDEEAVAWLSRSIETNQNHPGAHFWLAAVLALLGRMNEARAATKAGLALNPTFTISRARCLDERQLDLSVSA
jgi:Flp pilus assembly protein TadD